MPREATARSANGSQAAEPSAASFVVPDWTNLVSDAPARFSGALFGFLAKRLHAQADLFQELAACRSTPEMIKRQMDFLEGAWRDISAELPQLWTSTQPNAETKKAPD